MMGLLFAFSELKLDAALYFAGTEATCANIHSLGSTVYDNSNTLNIGSPACSCLSVTVTYQVTGHCALVANLTKLTHYNYLLRYKYKSL